jgi:hypothetical protein
LIGSGDADLSGAQWAIWTSELRASGSTAHAGFGAVWHAFNECPGSHNAVDGQ